MTRIRLMSHISAGLPEQLAADGVQLATLDLDKVLAPYGGAKVYPDAPEFVDALRDHGITPIIATNSPDADRLEGIRKQLGGIHIIHRGMKDMRPKPHPAMLLSARALASEGRAVHIDDQFKAFFAARGAGFDKFIWLKPRDSIFNDHLGTIALRTVEVPIYYASLLAVRTAVRLRSGLL